LISAQIKIAGDVRAPHVRSVARDLPTVDVQGLSGHEAGVLHERSHVHDDHHRHATKAR
jgi:hypothetical protein